jgi:hypothetical protein
MHNLFALEFNAADREGAGGGGGGGGGVRMRLLREKEGRAIQEERMLYTCARYCHVPGANLFATQREHTFVCQN